MFVCIAKSEPEWKLLLPNAQKALGRSITSGLDSRGLPLLGAAAFLAVLAEFEREGTDAVDALRNVGLVRRHVAFSFLVNLPRASFFTLSSLGLSVTAASDGDFAVVSGKLGEWVSAVADGTRLPQLRQFFCLMLAFFERENLGECWASFEKDHLPDGFYQLVRKPL